MNKLSLQVMLVLLPLMSVSHLSFAVEFNTDMLDSNDKKNIDFSRFSKVGYIMPGKYQLQVAINGRNPLASDQTISVLDSSDKSGVSMPKACLPKSMIGSLGMTESAQRKITWWHNGECADFSQLKGVVIEPDLSSGTLNINMPQSWLEYSDATWLPPSRWENGIPGFMLDYNLNGNITRPEEGYQTKSLSYNGTLGMNAGAWRLRSDYQGSITHTEGNLGGTRKNSDITRTYLYRALPQIKSKLTLGENYTTSDIFSTWSYTGVSLESDDRMLPPKLRGYAPQITGIADTNARVVVKQQDRVLYDSTVPAGPFTIQDLDSSVRGRLDVEVIENNGKKKTFQVDTAYVPYLTRPGQLRYKLVSGRSRNFGHSLEGPEFAGGELSWGIDNNWSVYGGSIVSESYQALALGIGRDLQSWGTVSTDIIQSVARLGREGTEKGKSWRVSYSKRFDDANADLTFTGYRFSERNYMTMQQFLDKRYSDYNVKQDKELYTVAFNKYFTDLHTSVSVQYSHQTYWESGASNYYTLSVNRYFDALGFKNVSLGLTGSRTLYQGRDNNSMYLRLSIPWGSGIVSYSGSKNDNRYSHTVGYSDSLNNGLDSYSINAGINNGGGDNSKQLDGYYSHHSSVSDISASFAKVQNSYSSVSLSATGGATITSKGAALHSGGINGGTRLLVTTDGVANVPVDGGRVLTNRWGTGVVTDINSYYRNTVSVDLSKLPDDVEATHSVVETALTEGAIGYRKFEVLKGEKLFVVLKLSDSHYPPFGATVSDDKGRELGMVDDQGLAWLSGVNPGGRLRVSWDGEVKCETKVPNTLPSQQNLSLLCQTLANH